MNKAFAIFDMDGTLVDSMVFWENLATEFLHKKGIQDISPTILEKIKPMTMTESAALFIQEYHLPGTAATVAAEMNAMMDAHYRSDIPLKSGADIYLKCLAKRGVRMCVASATAEELMEACLKRLHVAEYFEFLLSCESVGTGKNRPDVFFEAAKRLGGSPSNIAVYEDAFYAAQTAKAAGFYTVAVYDPSNHHHWEKLAALTQERVLDWADAAQAL